MNPKYLNLVFALALVFAMIAIKNLAFRYFVPLAVLEILVFALVGNWIVDTLSKKDTDQK